MGMGMGMGCPDQWMVKLILQCCNILLGLYYTITRCSVLIVF